MRFACVGKYLCRRAPHNLSFLFVIVKHMRSQQSCQRATNSVICAPKSDNQICIVSLRLFACYWFPRPDCFIRVFKCPKMAEQPMEVSTKAGPSSLMAQRLAMMRRSVGTNKLRNMLREVRAMQSKMVSLYDAQWCFVPYFWRNAESESKSADGSSSIFHEIS